MRVAVVCVVLCVAASCTDQGAVPDRASVPPPSLPPLVSAKGSAPAAPSAAELTWSVPAGWVEVAPSSTMRRAQYRIPGAAGDAECAVFYFGPGQGGEPISNARRWAGQFTRPDGSQALDAMKTSNLAVGGRSVLIVEVAGTYDGGMTMTAEPATPKPGYALLGAIAEGPDANWFFKVTGPEATVTAQRDAFMSLLRSLNSVRLRR